MLSMCVRVCVCVCVCVSRFRLVPFLVELRAVMDWVWTDTTLSLSNWMCVEDIYANIFIIKCSRETEKVWSVWGLWCSSRPVLGGKKTQLKGPNGNSSEQFQVLQYSNPNLRCFGMFFACILTLINHNWNSHGNLYGQPKMVVHCAWKWRMHLSSSLVSLCFVLYHINSVRVGE